MGMDEAMTQSALRVSLGWSSSDNDVSRFLEVWGTVMKKNSVGIAEAIA